MKIKLMSSLIMSIVFTFQLLYSISLIASDTVYYEIWNINNLEIIGGHEVTVFGNPEVVSTKIGDAVKFDGNGDRLIVDFNPLKDAKEFTVELVLKPDACYPDNIDPRLVHIQDPLDSDAKRLMLELRIDKNNQCYMDGFLQTDMMKLPLIDETLLHPTEEWHHIAVTYKDKEFTTYFNGIKELRGIVDYSNIIINTTGKTSLGARLNNIKFYSGLMKTLKVTHTSLDPKDFIFINDNSSSTK